jgi:hypothetical protein
MSELVSGIRLVKLFHWEPYFLERVNHIRDQELLEQRKFARARYRSSFKHTHMQLLITTHYRKGHCYPFLLLLLEL